MLLAPIVNWRLLILARLNIKAVKIARGRFLYDHA